MAGKTENAIEQNKFQATAILHFYLYFIEMKNSRITIQYS